MSILLGKAKMSEYLMTLEVFSYLNNSIEKHKLIFFFSRLKAEAHVAPKKDRRDREDRHRENRGKRRERPQTIQSHSIFEQGPADTITRKSGKLVAGYWNAPASYVAVFTTGNSNQETR